MKQLIVMAAMVALGMAIFQLIVGDADNSVLSVLRGVWEQEVMIRSTYP